MMSLSIAPFLAVVILASACAPAGPQAGPEGGDRAAPSGPKTLTLARDEPGNLISLMEGGGKSPGMVQDAVHQHLAIYDGQGRVRPQLAADFPSTTNGSWLIRPDGSMQTTYRLRPGVTWHDGTPLKARDFVFAVTVHQDQELPIHSALVTPLIKHVNTPDDLTLVIEWAATYPFASAITEDDLGPLPAHLLEQEYRGNKEGFPFLPYWKREFIGVGPYRLVEWEPGSHLRVEAYDNFYAGRARIDTIVFRIIETENTVVANLLAGAIDGSSLEFEAAVTAKREWERAGKEPVFLKSPRKWRFVGVQFRPETANPPEILDVRTRMGLLHAIDRQDMADVMYGEGTPLADAFIPPTNQKWEWVRDVAVRHQYDVNRARQLLGEVGWRRGADGAMVNSAGNRVNLSIWSTDEPNGVKEQLIISDLWRSVGFEVNQFVVPRAVQRDREYRAQYPAFDVTSVPVGFRNTTLRVDSQQCPSAGNRWTGNNRGCYQNPTMDRLVGSLHRAIDPEEQRRLYRDVVKIYSEDLPLLQLYFKFDTAIFRQGVTGPDVIGTEAAWGWNIQDWEIR